MLAVVLPLSSRRRKVKDQIDGLTPTGFSNMIEVTCQYLREEMARPLLQQHTDRFISFIWSVFFFVLAMNLLGMIPFGAISPVVGEWLGVHGLHLGGTPTANVWVTGTMSLITLAVIVINGLRIGKLDYVKHFCPGPLWMAPILVPVEIAGLLAKIFALTVRLFANMVAGHMVLAVLIGFILAAGGASAVMGFLIAVPVVLGSVALSLLEIFVALLQAFIFAFLTTVFIAMAVVFDHDGHEGALAH